MYIITLAILQIGTLQIELETISATGHQNGRAAVLGTKYWFISIAIASVASNASMHQARELQDVKHHFICSWAHSIAGLPCDASVAMVSIDSVHEAVSSILCPSV